MRNLIFTFIYIICCIGCNSETDALPEIPQSEPEPTSQNKLLYAQLNEGGFAYLSAENFLSISMVSLGLLFILAQNQLIVMTCIYYQRHGNIYVIPHRPKLHPPQIPF